MSMIRQVVAKVKDLLSKNGDVNKIQIIVLASRNASDETLEKLKIECMKADLTFAIKPELDKQDEALETFMRIMKSD